MNLAFSCCILLLIHLGFSQAGFHEKRLLSHLFNPDRSDAHNVMERPVVDDSAPINISMKFFLTQIVDVDEKNQMISTIIWIDMYWPDYHFQWNPQHFGNITNINLPYTSVWRPDILLYNCGDEKFDKTFPVNVVVKHTGMMQWMPPGLFKSTCNMDILWFPFDEQECILKFGSWTYFGDLVNLTLICDAEENVESCPDDVTVDLSEYKGNGEFHLTSAKVRRYSQRYECCNYDFIDIKMRIVIQRRALYYIFNLIVPCILISGMAMLVFTLPPDAGEKISLGVTILLSLTMFLQLVADKLPQTSEAVPLIGMYFSCTMILCSLSIVFTVLVLNYHHQAMGADEVPPCIKKFVNTWLAKLVRLERSQCRSREGKEFKEDDSIHLGQEVYPWLMNVSSKSACGWSSSGTSESAVNRKAAPVVQGCAPFRGKRQSKSLIMGNNMDDFEQEFRVKALVKREPKVEAGRHTAPIIYDSSGGWSREQKYPASEDNEEDDDEEEEVEDNERGKMAISTKEHQKQLEQLLIPILIEIRNITRRLREDSAEDEVKKEWQFTARVIDRFCLITFSVVNLISTMCIFFSAPTIIKSFQP